MGEYKCPKRIIKIEENKSMKEIDQGKKERERVKDIRRVIKIKESRNL